MPAQKLIIYFHGNAEDIGGAKRAMMYFGQAMQMHVLCVEYPGYGLYSSSATDADRMLQDSEIVFDYLN